MADGELITFYIWITCNVFATASMIALITLHAYKYYKHEVSNTSACKLYPMSMLTIATILLFAACVLCDIPARYHCHLDFAKAASVFYQLAKCCMYLIFVLRLHFVYKNTKYAFNANVLTVCLSLIVLIYVGLSIYAVFETYPATPIQVVGNVVYCERHVGAIYLAVSLLIDIFTNIATSICFIAPLVKVLRALKSTYSADHKDEEILKPIIKISVLALSITVSSIFAYAASIALGMDALFSFDLPLNCLCLMLMVSYYHALYERLCCCLVKYTQTKLKQIDSDDAGDRARELERASGDIHGHGVDSQNETRTMASLPAGMQYETSAETETVQQQNDHDP